MPQRRQQRSGSWAPAPESQAAPGVTDNAERGQQSEEPGPGAHQDWGLLQPRSSEAKGQEEPAWLPRAAADLNPHTLHAGTPCIVP